MKILVSVVVLLAVALVLYWATADTCTIEREDGVFPDIPLDQLMVWQQKIDCPRTDEPSEMSIQVRVDPADEKNRIYFDLTEARGHYVDTCNLTFWYTDGEDVTDPEDSPLVVRHVLNNYVEANGRLRSCIDVPWAELERIGGEMGRTENWRGRVEGCDRACVGNPKCLPNVTTALSCG